MPEPSPFRAARALALLLPLASACGNLSDANGVDRGVIVDGGVDAPTAPTSPTPPTPSTATRSAEPTPTRAIDARVAAAIDRSIAGRDALAPLLAPRDGGLEPEGAAFASAAWRTKQGADPSHLGAVFPRRADEAIRLGPSHAESWSLRLSPVGARSVEGSADRGRALWPSAWASTDVIATSSDRGAEWFLVLHDASAPTRFRWKLAYGVALHPSDAPSPGGDLDFLDEHGDAALRIHPAFAIDARGTRRAVTTELVDSELRLTLDARDLAYPIVIDPLADVPVWLQRATGSWGGVGRSLQALSFAANRTVMFGGATNEMTSSYTNQAWGWDGTSWTSIAGGPSAAVTAPAVTWKGSFLTLFGCDGTACSIEKTTGEAFNGSAWSTFCNSGSTCGVSARSGHMMAVANGQLVVFGGIYRDDTAPYMQHYMSDGADPGMIPYGDLWLLDATASSNVMTKYTPSGARPNARQGGMMAGDDDHKVVLLFGGKNDWSGYLADTWLWTKSGVNTGGWTCVCGCTDANNQLQMCPQQPLARMNGALAYDSARKKFVLVGGTTYFGSTAGPGNDTWEFDPTTKTWTQLCGGPQVSCGSSFFYQEAVATFDNQRRRVVMPGGSSQPGSYLTTTMELYVRGGSCSVATDCDSNSSGGTTSYCSEGTCCEVANCPQCQTCASSTSPGSCTNIAAGQPDTRSGYACAACDGAGNCKKALGVACSVSTDCASGYCVNGVCCGTSTCSTGYTCAPSGTCTKMLGQTCSSGGDCASGDCTDSVCCSTASCPSGSRCDYAGSPGVCAKSAGQSCASASECGSGFCVDGVCCTSACTGQCQACDVAGDVGTCVSVVGAPHGTRAACSGSGACMAVCNGSDPSACHYPDSTTTCGTPTCTSGVSTSSGHCDGAGGCTTQTATCGAYLCSGSACATSCASDAACAGGDYCKSGVCAPKEIAGTACTSASTCASGNCVDGVCCGSAACATGERCNVAGSLGTCAKPTGVACTSASECGSGFCVDGVCCDTACSGQCQACDVTGTVGTCANVVGAPHGARSACAGTGAGTTCGPRCDGSSATQCSYPGASTSCGAASCSSGVATHVSTCNGQGACGDVATSCGAYVCDATACKTSCASKADCTAGYYCSAGACVPIQGLGTSCTDPTACPSGYCVDGVCCAVDACGAGRSCSAGTPKGYCSSLNGTSCKLDSECASGHCVDGVCCDSACTGSCQACNQSGTVGKCVTIVGQPLTGHPPCSATPSDASCGLRCDGSSGTACTFAAPTVSCGAPACAGGIETQVSTCDGAGLCKPASATCGAYGCGPTACLTTCTGDGDCAKGNYCRAGACTPVEALGTACTDASQCASGNCTDGACCAVSSCGSGGACALGPGAQAGQCLKEKGIACGGASECASGHCVDGVCCDLACDGQCEACDVKGSEGTCTPVVGAPHGTARAACDALAADDCAKRSCDGTVRDKCNGFSNGATTSCGADACTADKRFQRHGSCDGKGSCAMPDPSACAPFACDATASSGCKSSCATDADCADGFTCKDGACEQGATCSDDGLSSISKTGETTSCTPYRCSTSGTCATACASSDDCAPGTTCDVTIKACVEPSVDATTSSGGCAMPRDGGRAPSLAGAMAAIAIVLARRRRAR